MSDQPMPTPGHEDVRPHVERIFAEVLASQCAKGEAKYGTRLQTHNGRDALADALAEIVDATQYVVQAALERAGLRCHDCGRTVTGPDAPLCNTCANEVADEMVGMRAKVAELEAERERYHDALIARHGGEPVTLLAELDAARARGERYKAEAMAARPLLVAKGCDGQTANGYRILVMEEERDAYAAARRANEDDENAE